METVKTTFTAADECEARARRISAPESMRASLGSRPAGCQANAYHQREHGDSRRRDSAACFKKGVLRRYHQTLGR
jgi:anti-sigma factor RsiW